jgi:S-adenosylmethionine:tRNA ribosyltransferase-isomerase
MPLPSQPLADFDYALPEGQIARYPLDDRGASRLLVYGQGQISHAVFADLARYLPRPCALVMNNTQVLAARLVFNKTSGARIELFCLQTYRMPLEKSLQSRQWASWECMVGNKKRLKLGETLEMNKTWGRLWATVMQLGNELALIRFHWEGGLPFAQVLDEAGMVPLPPYLHRLPQPSDKARYQTVYAKQQGAVAAPTAGLHFTPMHIDLLKSNGIEIGYTTLHVGAGTFQPVKATDLSKHHMHAEKMAVTRGFLSWLKGVLPVIAVGTTSFRCLESVYWLGHALLTTGQLPQVLESGYPYLAHHPENPIDTIDALLAHMDRQAIEKLNLDTRLFVLPGYTPQCCHGLITNFHQPKSTLLALVAALVGPDWRRIYQEALAHGYRFLSYGDSSLILPKT